MAGTVEIVVVNEAGGLQPVKGADNGDGTASLAVNDAAYAVKLTSSGGYTYIGEAVPGTLQAAAAWRCQRIDSSGTTTWAGGNGLFAHVATDLTALSYS
jgi:hypothetical protein